MKRTEAAPGSWTISPFQIEPRRDCGHERLEHTHVVIGNVARHPRSGNVGRSRLAQRGRGHSDGTLALETGALFNLGETCVSWYRTLVMGKPSPWRPISFTPSIRPTASKGGQRGTQLFNYFSIRSSWNGVWSGARRCRRRTSVTQVQRLKYGRKLGLAPSGPIQTVATRLIPLLNREGVNQCAGAYRRGLESVAASRHPAYCGARKIGQSQHERGPYPQVLAPCTCGADFIGRLRMTYLRVSTKQQSSDPHR